MHGRRMSPRCFMGSPFKPRQNLKTRRQHICSPTARLRLASVPENSFGVLSRKELWRRECSMHHIQVSREAAHENVAPAG